MSKGVSLITTLASSLIISVIVSAGVLFVAIPMIYPSAVDSSSLKNVHIESIEVKTDLSITNLDLEYQNMNETEITFSIKNQSSILAQFVGDFQTSVYNPGQWAFEIALVVQEVGNHTVPITKSTIGDSNTHHNSHNIVINYLTPSLPAGDYTVGVYWRSTYYSSVAYAVLKTRYINQELMGNLNTTRTLTLWEIAN